MRYGIDNIGIARKSNVAHSNMGCKVDKEMQLYLCKRNYNFDLI
jgi:hypothetical protein